MLKISLYYNNYDDNSAGQDIFNDIVDYSKTNNKIVITTDYISFEEILNGVLWGDLDISDISDISGYTTYEVFYAVNETEHATLVVLDLIINDILKYESYNFFALDEIKDKIKYIEDILENV